MHEGHKNANFMTAIIKEKFSNNRVGVELDRNLIAIKLIRPKYSKMFPYKRNIWITILRWNKINQPRKARNVPDKIKRHLSKDQKGGTKIIEVKVHLCTLKNFVSSDQCGGFCRARQPIPSDIV